MRLWRQPRRSNGVRRVLVLDATASLVHTMQALEPYAIEVSSIAFATEEAVNAAQRTQPDTVVMRTDAVPAPAEALRRLTAATPRSNFVLFGESAQEVGRAAESYEWSGDLSVLSSDALPLLGKTVSKGRVNTGPGHQRYQPKVITVFAGKGGVGKSTIAVNLAAWLAQRCRVVLVDLDLQFGSVSLMATSEDPRNRTILDIVRSDGTIDHRGLAEAILEGPEGLSLLCSPVNLETSDLVRPEHIGQLLGELRRYFDIVVVDTAPYLEARSLNAIDASEDIVIVTTTALTSANDTRRAMQFFEAIGIEREHLHMVINQITPKVYASRSEIDRVVGADAEASLPYAPNEVERAIVAGMPFVLGSPRSAISKVLTRFAARLLPKPASPYAELPFDNSNEFTLR